MHLFHHTIVIASIALIGNIGTISAAIDVDKSNVMPSDASLRAYTLVETTNRDAATRYLRQKKKTIGGDHTAIEERGWLKELLGYKLNLSTISDADINKILASEAAKEKAFHYLNRRDVNAQQAYMRLGGPRMSKTREKFWNAYGPYYDMRNQGNY